MTNKSTINQLSFNDTQIAFKHLSNQELKQSYWLYKVLSNNFLVKIGPSLTKGALALQLPITKLIKATIFKQFCGGETIQECTQTIHQLHRSGVGTILDYSVEGEEEEAIFDATAQEIIKTIDKSVELPEAIPFCVFKITGVARFALLEKLDKNQKLEPHEEEEWNKAKSRIQKICEKASHAGKQIMIDAEESWIQDTIDHIALSMMDQFNHQKAIVYNTYQLYRHDKLASLKADHAYANTRGFHLGAKLVRGAYMEKERKRSNLLNYKSPIQPNKAATDQDFNDAIDYCLQHLATIAFVAGTHNQQSCEKLANHIAAQQIPKSHPHIYFSQLLGMSDNLSFNLSNAGFNVAKYVPYGPVKSVLPYLFRRAEENTAIAGQMGRELQLLAKEVKRRGI